MTIYRRHVPNYVSIKMAEIAEEPDEYLSDEELGLL